MQEYIKELQDKVGLTEEQATKAVTVLFDKFKSQIPESFHSILGSFIDTAKNEGDSLFDKLKQFQKNAGGER